MTLVGAQSKILAHYILELETKAHEVFTVPGEGPYYGLRLVESATGTFTYKTLL